MMGRGAAVLSCLAVLLVVGGCGDTRVAKESSFSNQPEPGNARYKVGKRYKIKGKWYQPREDFDYSEVGVASWYGPNFHGKKTANGETFDKYAMTAAHRTLPLPSMVRVTNLANGKSVDVRINDRGPFAHNRIIDLSYAAAKKLGFTENGVAKVRVENLTQKSLELAAAAGRPGSVPAPRKKMVQVADNGGMVPAEKLDSTMNAEILNAKEFTKAKARMAALQTADQPQRKPDGLTNLTSRTGSLAPIAKNIGTDLFVQAGAFTSLENADKVKAHLKARGDNPVISSVYKDGRELHRVRIGPMASTELADAKLRAMRQDGFSEARVVID